MTAAPDRAEELRGHWAMLCFAVFVAGSFSFGGRIANDIDPLALTAIRFALAATVLAVVAAALGQLNRQAFRQPWRFAILGGLFGTYFVLMFEGLKFAPPVSISAVFTLTPFMAAGFGYLVLRQVVTRGMGVALMVGAVGALWVVFRGDLDAALSFDIGRGEAIYFWGCMAHALYIPLVPKLSRGEGGFAFALGTALGGAVMVGLLGAGQIMATDWSALPGRVWLVLAYLVLFSSAASISLIQFASRRLKAAKVMAYTYLVPSVVILLELMLAGSLPPIVTFVGVGLTMLALFMLLREGVRPQAD